MKVINALTIKEDMIANEYAETSRLYRGNKQFNVDNAGNDIPGSERSMVFKNKTWKNTETYNGVWNKIEDLMKKAKTNAATFDEASYTQLIDNLRIDITRRRFEYADLTPFITQISDGPNDSKSVTLDEFLPYGAVFLEDNFRGGSVNEIDQKYGATGSIIHQGYSVGWSETLENKLFNLGMDKMQKVMDAVARGYVAKRNDLSAGQIVGATYNASQIVAADTTGATPEDKLYITLNSAIETLTNLKDPQTGQIIQTGGQMYLMCYPGDVRRIGRAIEGQLNVGGKGTRANRAPLTEITAVLPYYGDTITVGKKQYTYTGVAKNYAYLFVPNIAVTRVKRGLTQETSMGSALTLSQEEMAWYFCQQNYMDEFFGSSNATVFAKTGANHGFVVKIGLPAA